jgi:hypothetical protein
MDRKEHVLWKNKYLKFQYAEYDDKKVGLSSRWHPPLDELYAKYYKDGRKNIPAIIADLDMPGLYVWYENAHSEIGHDIYLAAHDFTDAEQFLARDWFVKTLEISPLPQSKRVNGRQDRQLHFKGDDTRTLRKAIARAKFELLNR